MHLRERTILKFLAILLFCLELTASSVLSLMLTKDQSKISINEKTLSKSLPAAISSFLAEEQINEEREDKEQVIPTFHLTYIQSHLAIFNKDLTELAQYTQNYKAHASVRLFKLYRVFLI